MDSQRSTEVHEKRVRSSCPNCKTSQLFIVGKDGVCIECGLGYSWNFIYKDGKPVYTKKSYSNYKMKKSWAKIAEKNWADKKRSKLERVHSITDKELKGFPKKYDRIVPLEGGDTGFAKYVNKQWKRKK